MGLLKRLKARMSHKKAKDDFDRSLPPLLRGAATDLQFKNFRAARRTLLEALGRRDEIKDPALVRFALHYLGASWSLQDECGEGIEFFSDYIKRYPSDADAYSQRATMLWYSAQPQEAVNDYSRALKLLPNDFFALSGRGQALVELGQDREALRDLDLALQSLDQFLTLDLAWRKRCQAYIRNGRAAALAGLGEFEHALQEFEVSISLCPDNAWVYYKRAHTYDVRNQRDKAISDYRLALAKRDPGLPHARREHAEACLQALLAEGSTTSL